MNLRFEKSDFGRSMNVYDGDTWIGSVGNGVGFSSEYAVGYGFSEAYWGKGIATMALQKWLELNSDLACVQAVVSDWNVASQRVLEKCGFVRVDTTKLPDDSFMPRFWYELKREVKKAA